MSQHYILTAEQAAKLRVRTGPFSRLEPVELATGGFALPVAAKIDAAHGDHRDEIPDGATVRDIQPADCKWHAADRQREAVKAAQIEGVKR